MVGEADESWLLKYIIENVAWPRPLRVAIYVIFFSLTLH